MLVRINRFSRWLYLSLPHQHDVERISLVYVSRKKVQIKEYDLNGFTLRDGKKVDYDDLFIVGRQSNEFEFADVPAETGNIIETFFDLAMNFHEQSQYKKLRDFFGIKSKRLSLLSPIKEHFTWSFLKLLEDMAADESKIPSERQIAWLEKIHEHALLGEVFDRKFRFMNDYWAPAKASSFWRKAKNKDRALASTNKAIDDRATFSDKQRAASLTSRAAVLRDMRNLTAAEKCLRWAYKLDGGSNDYISNVWRKYDGI